MDSERRHGDETVRDAPVQGSEQPALPIASRDQLQLGAALGPFKIEARLGAGGMGTVFRATDTRLDRKVAIKLCDARFVSRFDREAKAISALNHPGICALYDVGPNYLVMELIHGETLEARLARGPMSLEDTLRIGEEIADALAEAHAAGIAHRDLKPSNVMLSRRGVKVLDFGLARLDQPAESPLTRSGAVMGTPLYMAPEQAKGAPAHAQADMFSLGLMLHEMATGKLPYPGASLGNMLASDETARLPTHSRGRAVLPPALDKLIAQLLAADPEKRPQSARVRDGLRALAAPKTARRKNGWIVAAAVTIVLVAIGIWRVERAMRPEPVEVTGVTRLVNAPGDKLDPAFSPNGEWLAFSWAGDAADRQGIYVVPRTGGDPRRLTQSPTSDVSPSWSPDGKRIAYQRLHAGGPNELMWVAFENDLSNGEGRHLRDVRMADGTLPTTITWTTAGDALLVPIFDPEMQRGSLFRVGVDAESSQRIVAGRSGSIHIPSVSADGRWLSYLEGYALRAQRLGIDGSFEGDPIDIVSEGVVRSPVWAPDGSRLLFLRPGEFRVLEWDARARSVQTVYVASTSPQAMTATWAGGDPQIALSILGRQVELRTLDLADPALPSGAPRTLFQGALSGAYSPDGRWIAFTRQSQGSDIWIARVDGQNTRRLTNLSALALRGIVWSPEGSRIAFHARLTSTAQIFVLDVDPERVMNEPQDATVENDAHRLLQTDFNLVSPQWSRDGRYLYVLRYDVGGGRLMRVSAAGGELEDLFESDTARLHPAEERVYYVKAGQTGLFTRSLIGDVRSNPEERVLTDANARGGFGVDRSGIYYNSLDDAGNPAAIRFYDFASARSSDVAPLRIPADFFSSLQVSPDGKQLLYDAMSDADGSLLLLQLRSRTR